MGFRFRKSIKIAPGVKLNLNKKSSGITFGGKGFHYTFNSKGKRTSTIGIPGTGLSYSTTSGGKKRKSKKKNRDSFIVNETEGVKNMKKKSNKKGCLAVVMIPVVLLGGLVSCFGDEADTETTTTEYITEEVTTVPSSVADNLIFETTEINITTTEKEATSNKPTITEKETTTKKATTTQEETTTKKVTTTKKATTTVKPTTTKKPTTTQKITTTKKVTTTKKATTTKKVTTTKKKVETTKKTNNGVTDARYVLNTNSKKFHYPSCHSAKKISSENYAEFNGTRDEIMVKGYTPCGNCDP